MREGRREGERKRVTELSIGCGSLGSFCIFIALDLLAERRTGDHGLERGGIGGSLLLN